MSDKRVDDATGTETVGHEWDGIEELDTPLPRWWLWTFYATIVFAIGYTIAYPAWPMVDSATAGLLGWSSRGQFAQETAIAEQEKAATFAAIGRMPIEELPRHPELMRAAVEGGRAAFRVNCVQCHGSGAAGGHGYPNLNDDDWLWGGDLKAIETTITDGIRDPHNAATRTSMMPSFGHDGILTPAQVDEVASHVLSLSGKAKDNPTGAQLFADNCTVCHGPDGKGSRKVGAPNLTDAIWQYGGTREDIVSSVTNAHHGVMPAWRDRLSPVTIRMLAAYVHSLGGGEAAPAPAATTAPVAALSASAGGNVR
jgi:cytochrome c oxidase cbb3-type subunit 3